MAGGRLRCLSCFVTCAAVLLLGVCLNDVEALSCQNIIHKQVGDTVEFSSCLSTERNITSASWKYKTKKLTDMDEVLENIQLQGRVKINPKNFNLTVTQLKLEDSGDFSFSSEVNDIQRKDITITLHVHERIIKPELTVNITWHPSNQSCTVLLECFAKSNNNVIFKWTMKNQTRNGSRLQDTMTPQDEETEFTCTVSNVFNEQSESRTVKCSNDTSKMEKPDIILIVAAAGGGCLVIVFAVGICITVCYCKQRQTGSNTNDITIYADITDIVDNQTATMKSCSVYETIDNRVNTVTPETAPQTVYDKIQLNRMKDSPNQDI